MLDLIVVSYDTKSILQDCVEKLRANTLQSFQITVVDNASSDGTQEWLQTQKDLRVIQNEENLGYAKALNQGIKAGDQEYIFCLNSDVFVSYNWSRGLTDVLQKKEGAAIVSPRMVDDGNRIVHAGVVDPLDYFGEEGFGDPAGIGNFVQTDRVIAVSGACMGIKRDLLPIIGYFDEEYPFYWEDRDYCYQARSKGYEVWYVGAVTVKHLLRQSPRSILTKDHNKQGQKRFLKKWGEMIQKETHPDKTLSWVQTMDPSKEALQEKRLKNLEEKLAEVTATLTTERGTVNIPLGQQKKPSELMKRTTAVKK